MQNIPACAVKISVKKPEGHGSLQDVITVQDSLDWLKNREFAVA